jgi:hypothetical protein
MPFPDRELLGICLSRWYGLQAVGPHQDFLLALTLLICSVLLMGMLYRERHGVGNIGLESLLMLLFYLGGMGTLLVVGGRGLRINPHSPIVPLQVGSDSDGYRQSQPR